MKKIYVVGLGPGGREHMTELAIKAMEESNVIAGYTVYVELVKEFCDGKKILSTPMKKEVDRCQMAIDEAEKGNVVSMVCSGDAGIYGMAGLIYQLSEERDIEVVVVPGITAACSGAAVLGAPLTHDFAVISMSDLLTPFELIMKRLDYAAKADLSICIYNPSSRSRHDYLQKACDKLLETKSPDTVCGFVKNIGREGEEGVVMTLKELRDTQVDMFTTVFIGNSQTMNIGGKMVTPRGYKGV